MAKVDRNCRSRGEGSEEGNSNGQHSSHLFVMTRWLGRSNRYSRLFKACILGFESGEGRIVLHRVFAGLLLHRECCARRHGIESGNGRLFRMEEESRRRQSLGRN
jgi:hypothetical protein